MKKLLAKYREFIVYVIVGFSTTFINLAISFRRSGLASDHQYNHCLVNCHHLCLFYEQIGGIPQ